MNDFTKTLVKGYIADVVGHQMGYREVSLEDMKLILEEIIAEIMTV